MNGNGKGKPDSHAARVCLHRLVDEIANVGEFDYLFIFRVNLCAGEAEYGPIELDVLSACQLFIRRQILRNQADTLPHLPCLSHNVQTQNLCHAASRQHQGVED